MQTTTHSSRRSTRRSIAESSASSGLSIARLTGAIFFLSLVGLGIAGYLSYTHFNADALVCTVGDCGTVQKSEYSTIGPIPIALLGMGMFITVGALALMRAFDRGPISLEHATIASWTLVFSGLLYYAYLTYLELFVINAICQWCVATSIAAILIFAIDSVILWRVVINEE